MEALAGTRPLVRAAPRLLRLASDERLVELVRAGDERAFEVVYDRHHRGVLSFCRHMLGSAHEAEDAVQHTFIAAYRDLTGSDKDIRLRPWLYAIARNRCLTLLRARREKLADDLDEFEPSAQNLAAEVQRREDLRELLRDLSRLPDEQRAALVLAELGDLSHDDIASVIGVRREKVKALVFQAREALAAGRAARETPCSEIREELATARGGALRRAPLRRHLRDCAGCQAFRKEVDRQRGALALLLPVTPSAALKAGSLPWIGGGLGGGAAGAGAGAAAGGAGGAGGAASGGLATAGGGAALSSAGGAASAGGGGFFGAVLGGGALAKGVAVVVATGAVAGGVVTVDEVRGGDEPARGAEQPPAPRAPSANAAPTAQAPTPPQSPNAQGTTPQRRAGEGGNADRAAGRRDKPRKKDREGRGKPETTSGGDEVIVITPGAGNGNGNGGAVVVGAPGNGNGNGYGYGGGNGGGSGNGGGGGAPVQAPASGPGNGNGYGTGNGGGTGNGLGGGVGGGRGNGNAGGNGNGNGNGGGNGNGPRAVVETVAGALP